jgi:signal transduction histidine kinase
MTSSSSSGEPPAVPGSDYVEASRATVEQVFPFFFVLGGPLLLLDAGRSLRKLSGTAAVGAPFYEVFAPKRPDREFTFAELRGHQGRLFTLILRDGGVLLRGQFEPVGGNLMFVGSPWISEPDELRRLGLTLNDFAAFDPTLELLQLVQIQKTVAEDLRKLTARLTAQTTALEAAARTKDAFLASMRHELRTPLAGILGLTETLLDQSCGPLNEKQARFLGLVQQSGDRLLHLLNNILDFVQLGAENQALDREDCAVQEICSVALQRAQPAAEKRRQLLRVDTAAAAGLKVRGDRRRLVAVLGNLLDNASKFTAAGGEFGLAVRAGAGQVRLEVWDRGIGIADADRPKLFQPFVQVDGRTVRRYEGAGLGLALADRLVRLHGGRIEVESAVGLGSRFSVVLPLAEAAG